MNGWLPTRVSPAIRLALAEQLGKRDYVRYGKPIAESGNGLEYISLYIPSHEVREGEFQQ
jgi:hypothetical protein